MYSSYAGSQGLNGEPVTNEFLNEVVGAAAKAVCEQIKNIAVGKGVLQAATRGW